MQSYPSVALDLQRVRCPFYRPESCRCDIAPSDGPTAKPSAVTRVNYCCSDDHDDCPRYLARLLRSSASRGYESGLAAK